MKEIKSAITGPCYTQTDKVKLANQAMIKIGPIILFLGKKDYLFGSELKYMDFYALEIFDFIQWLTENAFFTENKSVAKYVKRMKGLRQMKRYIKSDRYLEKPYNNKVAKINNLWSFVRTKSDETRAWVTQWNALLRAHHWREIARALGHEIAI